jgi:hypothetical protein
MNNNNNKTLLGSSNIDQMKSSDTLISCPGIFGWNPLESLKVQPLVFVTAVEEKENKPRWLQSNVSLEMQKVTPAVVTPPSSPEPPTKRVRFGSVRIRAYPMTVGDHPSCEHGVPLTLCWNYEQLPDVPVSYFERNRKRRKDYQLTALHREQILTKLGHTKEELKEALKEKDRIRKQRKATQRMFPLHKFGEKVLNLIRL